VNGLPNLPIVAHFKGLHEVWFSPEGLANPEIISNPALDMRSGMPFASHSEWDRDAISSTKNEAGNKQDEERVTPTHVQPEASASHQHPYRKGGDANRSNFKRTRDSGFEDLRGEGLIIGGELRSKRRFVPAAIGGRYQIPKCTIEALSSPSRRALMAIGGADVIASAEDVRLSMILGQFATAYASATNAETRRTG
jgi:hypothetical protein